MTSIQHLARTTIKRISLLAIFFSLAGNLFFSAFTAAYGNQQQTPNIRTDIRTLKLINASTGKAIANNPVHIISDNGIRCKRAPCPTNNMEWKGKSDQQGRVHIPSFVLQADTYIEAGNYEGRLPNSIKGKGIVLVRLSRQRGSTEVANPDRSKIIYERAELFLRGGETSLMLAARKADIQKVTDLLAQGAIVNAKDKKGRTALFYANPPVHTLEQITEYFLTAGPVNSIDVFKEPFLSLAKIMTLLIEHNADVNVKGAHGETALMVAADVISPRAVSALIGAQADVNALDADGNTALLRALMPISDSANPSTQATDEKRANIRRNIAKDLLDARVVPLVTLLIGKGADVNLQNKKGESALILANRIAERFGHQRLIEILQQAGAKSAIAQTGKAQLQGLSEPTLPTKPDSWLLRLSSDGGVVPSSKYEMMNSDGIGESGSFQTPFQRWKLSLKKLTAITKAIANANPSAWEKDTDSRCCDRPIQSLTLHLRQVDGTEKIYEFVENRKPFPADVQAIIAAIHE